MEIEWKRCSDELPKWSGTYLVTYSDATVHTNFFHVKKTAEGLKKYWEKSYVDSDDDIKAWAELPEPYPFWEDEEKEKKNVAKLETNTGYIF